MGSRYRVKFTRDAALVQPGSPSTAGTRLRSVRSRSRSQGRLTFFKKSCSIVRNDMTSSRAYSANA